MRRSFQISVVLVILGLAGFSFWNAIAGIVDGSVMTISRHESNQVLLATSPRFFWECIMYWLALGACLSWMAVLCFRETATLDHGSTLKNKKTTPKDEDQIVRLKEEMSDGTWLANAQQRARRRKSPWNLLLPGIGLPLWLGSGFLLSTAGESLHAALHGAQLRQVAHEPMSIALQMISIGSLFATLAPALLLTNFLVYQIPPARRALDAEDRGYKGVNYRSSQRALSKASVWVVAICVPIILIGLMLK